MTYHRFQPLDSSFEEIRVDTVVSKELSIYDGYFLADWSKSLGFGQKKTLKYLKSKVKAGRMRVMKVPIHDITGRINYSYAYIPYEE